MNNTVVNFFETVLPAKGFYAVVHKESGTNWFRHTVFEDLHSLITTATEVRDTPTDVWFAVAGFTEKTSAILDKNNHVIHRFARRQDNVCAMRSLFLDIDVGADKPYQTTADALIALRDFCVTIGIDIPTIVYSGSGGLHCYWSFTEDLDKDTWRTYATALHEAVLAHGLDADPARTRDCASILRVPATFNWKSAFPNPVQVKYVAPQKDLAYYEGVLGKYKRVINPTQNMAEPLPPAFADAISKIDFGKLLGNAQVEVEIPEITLDFPTRPATDVVAQCPQLQQQNGASEPVWRGMLATLRHCDGGIEMAHKLSKQDPRYDEEATANKLAQLADKGIAPYTCKTFEGFRPSVCASCPHKGKINSPISVPESKITVTNIDDDGSVEKVITGEETVASIRIPQYDTAKYRVDETGCYVLKSSTDGLKQWWHRFYDYPVYPIQKVKDRNPQNELVMSYVFRKHHRKGWDDFQIMGETLMGQGLYGHLGSVGFILDNEERKHMVGFMIDLLKEVGHELEETPTMDKLGWDDNMKSFLLGNKLYKTNGQVVEVSPKGYAADYSARTVAKGDLEQWKKIANVYNRKGLEWGQVALASAFASPLMPIGSLERAALLFLTGEKGAGKSTALYMAVSVFGDPTKMLVNKDDTYLSRIAKLGIMSNISVGFDEMTDMSPREASELAYQITQGRGKDRMADGGKGIQHNKTFWSCLPIMSANDSIINHLANHSFDATAQMSRVLEINATNINSVYSQEEFEQCELLVRTLPYNYGLAGDVYMRWVTTNMEKVQQMIYRTEKLFVEKSGLDNTYRFWTYMCTRMLVGITIAKSLGLVDYDLDSIMEYLIMLTDRSKRRINNQNSDVDSVLGEFLNDHLSNTLTVRSDNRTKEHPYNPEMPNNDVNYVVKMPSPNKELLVRAVRDEHMVYISKQAVKTWCAHRGIPHEKFMESVNMNGTLDPNAATRVVLGRLTQLQETSSKVSCILVRLDPHITV